MNISIRALAIPTALALLSCPVQAAEAGPPAPVLEWSFYVLLIFAACVAAFVFFTKTSDKKTAPLSNVIAERPRPLKSVDSDTSVTECIRLMNSHNIGALLVIEDDKLAGMFTERDALNKVLAAGVDPVTTRVSEVMTKDPLCVDPSTTVEEAMHIVTHRRIRHLPILHNGELVGLISSGDLTHWMLEDQVGEIRELVDAAASRRRR
jgi:CBS domain-containing protein